ncbi:hypothetical protein PR003_g21316 [Phytophthora rubi]|uniref:Uncharacterized protein n=1 Tax=Phytophthora rubi TaxID=129364 RepID=A0A6A3GB63_9STRA|nr:hypothetical protein PR001_g32557 [Phytophthora rubi]KAE9306125.1 hypothetical protein PR003_g21316 [Phytophthora rubi]
MDKIEFADGDVPIKEELKEIKLKIAKGEDATETKQSFLSALPFMALSSCSTRQRRCSYSIVTSFCTGAGVVPE